MERAVATENGARRDQWRSPEQTPEERNNNIQDRFVDHVRAPQ